MPYFLVRRENSKPTCTIFVVRRKNFKRKFVTFTFGSKTLNAHSPLLRLDAKTSNANSSLLRWARGECQEKCVNVIVILIPVGTNDVQSNPNACPARNLISPGGS